MKIVDNFLTNDEFENIKNILMSDDFPWYFNDYITDEKDTNNFYFTHLFYNSMDIKSNFFYLFKNFLE